MKLLIILVMAVGAVACSTESAVDVAKVKQEVLSVDSAFSAMSEDKGMSKAFLYYADTNVVELNNGEYPTIGIVAMSNRFRRLDNSKFVMRWKAAKCEVASSGDLAYTFGEWRIDQALPNGADTTLYGNYVSIWKKNDRAQWKLVLDAGTSTPGKMEFSSAGL
ncbi:MAG: hypothetical protein V4616_05230 [Bacteroidota bacterium]